MVARHAGPQWGNRPGVRWRDRGFSLVELIYVMAIVGILAGLVLPQFDLQRMRVDGAVQELATDLMAAQRLAVLRGHDVVVSFDLSADVLRVHADADNDRTIQGDEEWRVVQLPEGVAFGLPGGASRLEDAAPPVSFEQAQGSNPSLTFHRNGSASEQGVIYLAPAGGGTEAEHARALEVIRSTARVQCWSLRTGTWREVC